MKSIELTINERLYKLEIPETEVLADTLRERLGLTGTKKGCEVGECGACTVIMNERTVNSCLVLSLQADGSHITTIEGVGKQEELHAVQQAFLKHDAVQCGFCSPGMILSVINLLQRNPEPEENEIREAIAGNLCSCTGYQPIINTVKAIVKNK